MTTRESSTDAKAVLTTYDRPCNSGGTVFSPVVLFQTFSQSMRSSSINWPWVAVTSSSCRNACQRPTCGAGLPGRVDLNVVERENAASEQAMRSFAGDNGPSRGAERQPTESAERAVRRETRLERSFASRFVDRANRRVFSVYTFGKRERWDNSSAGVRARTVVV